MKAYKHLVALVIVLLVNKSLAKPGGMMWTRSNVTNTFVILDSEHVATPALESGNNRNNNRNDDQNDKHNDNRNDDQNDKHDDNGNDKRNFDIRSYIERGSDIIPVEHHLDGTVELGEKRYFFETVFKSNWYEASLYCRSRDMHLVSIASQEENDRLVDYIQDLDMHDKLFWTSGTDQAKEGAFFWMSNGKPFTFENWFEWEPNNDRSLSDAGENCVALLKRNGIGFKWNDIVCSVEAFFICEEQ